MNRAPGGQPHGPALAVAAIAAIVTTCAAYAALRGYDVLAGTEPNPPTVTWSAKIAMFWRLAMGAYVAGMVAPAAYAMARRDEALAAKRVAVVAMVVAAGLTVQALVLP